MSRRPRYEPGLNANLPLAAWRTLITLAHTSDLTGQEITALWGMEKMGVNRAISDLIDRGLVEREADPADKRRLPLRLTKSGRDLFAELWPGAGTDYAFLADAVTPDELAAFCRVSEKLLARARVITCAAPGRSE